MQFAVPQFTDVEDQLIGKLTLKQFLACVGVGGLVVMFWSIFGLSFLFFIFSLPVTIIGLIVIFGKFNGRPYFSYIGPMLNYFTGAKVRVYKREGGHVTLSQKVDETKIDQIKPEAVSQSRLKNLAYVLDQKAQVEQELIEKETISRQP